MILKEQIKYAQQEIQGVMNFKRESPRLKPWDESAVIIFN